MKDFPFFTTENGVASLTLKEIPYANTAYIKIQDTLEPEKLLEECIGFCKMAGAEKIYASNHSILEKYPLHTTLVQMSCCRESLPDTDAALFPVTEQTIERWREIYNERMKNVPNFSYMSTFEGRNLLKKGNGYFVHKDGVLLGIGIASGDRLDAIAAVKPGSGETVVLALNSVLSGTLAILDVASNNHRAMCLYERLGFIKNREISTWFQVL